MEKKLHKCVKKYPFLKKPMLFQREPFSTMFHILSTYLMLVKGCMQTTIWSYYQKCPEVDFTKSLGLVLGDTKNVWLVKVRMSNSS